MKTKTRSRVSKIYEITLRKFSLKRIIAQKGSIDSYRIAVRDLEGKFSRSKGDPVYILSNPAASGITQERFDELEGVLRVAEITKNPIRIKYVRKFGKKLINEIN